MEKVIQLRPPKIETIEVTLEGTSSLISHRWSDKAKKMMRDTQAKAAKTPREIRNPQKEYEDSIYWTEDGRPGMPSVAFKAAAVRAGTYSDMKMTFTRGAFHIAGELVPIDGEPSMREDMVRLNGKVADFRYRAEFKTWSSTVPLQYNSSVISVEQLVNLFVLAGFAVGVGEWRPERNGQHGRFEVGAVAAVSRAA